MPQSPILPPAMLGILGGGQLGRMFTIAAKTMGYKVTVLDPDQHAPAAQFADHHLCAAFDDQNALNELAKCAAITTEFENVNADAMLMLAETTRVSPSGHSVAIAQDRFAEKKWINQAGLPTAPFAEIHTLDDCAKTLDSNLFPAILKTARLGYDGKGQIKVNTQAELADAFQQLGQVPCILEKQLNLFKEVSVVIARLSKDAFSCFPVAENQHKNGILDVSIVPARIDANIQQQAQQMTQKLADELDYQGVLAVELFVLSDNSLVVNEIAPRPHNSGHYTLDACATDQFQQQVRMMCNLPPANTELLKPCTMINLLGDSWQNNQNEPNWQPLLNHPQAYLHLYGKQQARMGRKMGHFTVLAETPDQALQTALHLQASL